MPAKTEHGPVTKRYTDTADIGEQNYDRKLEACRNVLVF